MSEELLSGRVLVTGASGGLGGAIARKFAEHHAELVLSGRRTDVLERLAAELGGRAITADLANPQDVSRLAGDSGELDVLVANAALPASGTFTEFSEPQIDTILDVNLRSQIALAHGLLPGMLARGRGHLVFISSLGGKAASPASSLYNATKFGLRGFALGLREDLRGTPVGVSVILPGFISGAGMFVDAGAKLPPGVGTRTPDDVAAAVLRAISHDRAEVHVSSPPLRIGTDIAMLAPELAGRVQRLLGGDKVAAQFSAGQIDKRPTR